MFVCVKVAYYNWMQQEGPLQKEHLPDGPRLFKDIRQMGGQGDSQNSGTWGGGFHSLRKWDRIEEGSLKHSELGY